MSFVEHEEGTANPGHIISQCLDFLVESENTDLKEIYAWKPEKVGKKSRSKINKSEQISDQRKRNYTPPNETERKGFSTSRVGQGYYRNKIVEKWNGKCAVTGSSTLAILVASHIVRWSDSNDTERLDVENGILLSPLYDALFDKHFISFDDDGHVIFSSNLSRADRNALGIITDIQITVTDGMKPYLKRHRAKLR